MKISIIVNIYNCESYIYKCLDSILSQKYDDFEVILIDNGSTDKCKLICDEYTMKDLRVKAIHLDSYSGIENAFIKGISESEGEYVTFINNETYLDRFFLTRITKNITTYNADFIFCDCIKNTGTRNERVHTSIIESGIYEQERISSEILPRFFSDSPASFTQIIELDYKAKIYNIDLVKKAMVFFNQNKFTKWEDILTIYALKNCNKMLYMKNNFLYYCNSDNPDIDSYFPQCIAFFNMTKKIMENSKISNVHFDTFKAKIILNYIIFLSQKTQKMPKELILGKLKELSESDLFTQMLCVKNIDLTSKQKLYFILLKNKLYNIQYLVMKYFSDK